MSEAAGEEMVAKTIVQLLEILGFQRFLKNTKSISLLTPKFFSNFEGRHFREMVYFLFVKYYGQKAAKAFKAVYPARDIQQENEFKKICIDWLQEISDKHPEAMMGKILPIVFHRLSGEKFMRLMYRFTHFVAQAHATKEGITYESIQASSLEDCEKDHKEIKERKESLLADHALFDELLDGKIKDIENAMADVNNVQAVLDQLPPLDDVEKALEMSMKNVNGMMKMLEMLPIMDPSIDFGESFDFSLIGDREKVVVNKIRDCLILFKKFHSNPQRFTKEMRKFAECERLFNELESLNKDAERKIVDIEREVCQLKTEILATERANQIRQQLHEITVQFNYQTILDDLEVALRLIG